jgi:hypothetical protein
MSVIYTAITGGYDILKPPAGIEVPGQDVPLRIAFMDDPDLQSRSNHRGWHEIKPTASICMDPHMQSRRYKILAHEVLPPGTEFSLWVDGSVEFNSDLHPEVLARQFLGNSDLALFRHRLRDCLYDESHACQRLRLDDPSVMARQMNRYRAEGYPRNNGLAECAVILRRHTPSTARLNELWWQEVSNGSRRDQLSFNYACWKLGIKHSLLPGTMLDNPFFKWHPHAKARAVADPALGRKKP